MCQAYFYYITWPSIRHSSQLHNKIVKAFYSNFHADNKKELGDLEDQLVAEMAKKCKVASQPSYNKAGESSSLNY